MKNAVLYLRSSKDRRDVSIGSQRRELTALAKREGYSVHAEYSDTVESAKDENRPSFQRLLHDLRNPDRKWSAILAIDTSRISRRTYFAHAFRHECAKRGVEVVYSKLPQDMDPITEVIVHSSLAAMDEVHSLMSRQKGLAGMAENVRSGWRAGGRAPLGYRLVKIGTGSYREGQEVTKTRLEASEDASRVRRYLQGRIRGETRRTAAEAANLSLSPSSLIGIEWNALTYAGATVWNVHNEYTTEGYKGGTKRRPRDEWVIQRDTHEALIEWDDAESLLDRLANSKVGKAVSEAKSGNSPYLLTGLLESPSGKAWTGSKQTYYRYVPDEGERGRLLPCSEVDDLVLGQIGQDMQTDEFVKAMTQAARERVSTEDPAEDLRAELIRLNDRIGRQMELAEQLEDPAPALRRVDALERQRKEMAAEVERLEREHSINAMLSKVTESDIRRALSGAWQEVEGQDRQRLKPALRALIERVVLDPQALEVQIHYRLNADRCLTMASPRDFAGYTPITLAVAAGRLRK